MLTPEQQRENAKKWIAALRSGKYQQTVGKLHTIYKRNAYCCLGVACEIFKDELELEIGNTQSLISYNGKYDILPPAVRDHIGLHSCNGYPINNSDIGSLLLINDKLRKTFAEIADLLEANWTDYFVHSKE